MRDVQTIITLIGLVLVSACSFTSTDGLDDQIISTVQPSVIPTLTMPAPTNSPSPSATPSPKPSATPRISVEQLQNAARQVCAQFSSSYLTDCLQPEAYHIYLQGIQAGNDAHTFIVIGDSNSVPAVFMGQYERCCASDLQAIADWFAGSFALSHAIRQNGLTVKDVSRELLAQVVAQNNPSIALLALGSNWAGELDEWVSRYEQIILILINEYKILPVLWTVTDTPHLNVEIRALATQYKLPLVEWAEIGQPYLSPDGVHFTVEGWSVRSRVGLEVLSQLRSMFTDYEKILE